jgi:uncharacterized protein (TIGR00299 family) protein
MMTEKVLYIDASAGLSGDMLAGALLDLGWPLSDLREKIDAMGLNQVKLEAVRIDHMGISACRLSVDDDADQACHRHEGHAHPHDHGHCHSHEHPHDHAHTHEHIHAHEHQHEHHGHGHDHGHEGGHCHDNGHNHHGEQRGLPQILEMLTKLPAPTGKLATKVFERLAKAEAKVHGKSPEEVHFHEVGAVDAIVDVVAFCTGLTWLKVDRVICSPLPLARGFFTCAHGRMPLPPPAVVNLLDGAPIVPWPVEQETVTPTGAALVTTVADEYGQLPAMRLEKAGVGGGSRNSTYAPNVVRLMLGQTRETGLSRQEEIAEIVCHLDDMHPEDLPLAYERLFAAGALDVAASPLLMKKSRSGLALTVMSKPEDAEALADVVLNETTGLGVRIRKVQRRVLPRRMVKVDTPWGPVMVKLAQSAYGTKSHVESDDIVRICREHGLTPPDVRQKILELLDEEFAD